MIFLKLGGSLITEKDQPETAREDTLLRLCGEIADFREEQPDRPLLIGHGSGSFGHSSASRYRTQHGAQASEEWRGFSEVWSAANRLNRLVIDGLRAAGLPALSFPPSASGLADGGHLVSLAIEPIRRALGVGLVPVVQGDVVFDLAQGAAIASTEEVFYYLAQHLKPTLFLLAGTERGVYRDYPDRAELLPAVTDGDLPSLSLAGADAPDVTGGMAAKVEGSLRLAAKFPEMSLRIFSGEEPGLLGRALRGEPVGTQITSSGSKVQ